MEDANPSDRPERTPRPTSARRLQLLDVTIDLIARDGIDAVTHRRVAELAGVPLGSTTYYFSSREDMLVQALECFGQQEAAALTHALERRSAGRLTSRRCTDAVLAIVAPQTSANRSRAVAQFALLTEAARRPALSAVVREWNQVWLTALAGFFDELGAADAQLQARSTLALIDGLLISQLAAPEPDFVVGILKPALQSAFERGQTSRTRAVDGAAQR